MKADNTVWRPKLERQVTWSKVKLVTQTEKGKAIQHKMFKGTFGGLKKHESTTLNCRVNGKWLKPDIIQIFITNFSSSSSIQLTQKLLNLKHSPQELLKAANFFKENFSDSGKILVRTHARLNLHILLKKNPFLLSRNYRTPEIRMQERGPIKLRYYRNPDTLLTVKDLPDMVTELQKISTKLELYLPKSQIQWLSPEVKNHKNVTIHEAESWWEQFGGFKTAPKVTEDCDTTDFEKNVIAKHGQKMKDSDLAVHLFSKIKNEPLTQKNLKNLKKRVVDKGRYLHGTLYELQHFCENPEVLEQGKPSDRTKIEPPKAPAKPQRRNHPPSRGSREFLRAFFIGGLAILLLVWAGICYRVRSR